MWTKFLNKKWSFLLNSTIVHKDILGLEKIKTLFKSHAIKQRNVYWSLTEIWNLIKANIKLDKLNSEENTVNNKSFVFMIKNKITINNCLRL